MIVNNKRNCGHPRITKLIHKNRCYTEKADIAHQLNTHFTNVGRELEIKLPTSNENANTLNVHSEIVLPSVVFLCMKSTI